MITLQDGNIDPILPKKGTIFLKLIKWNTMPVMAAGGPSNRSF